MNWEGVIFEVQVGVEVMLEEQDSGNWGLGACLVT